MSTDTGELIVAPHRSEAETAFALTVRKARAMCASTLVPEAYRGEQNLANVMIAMEVAQRIGANELMVMQNLYVVHGRPSWSSTFLIATVNACGRFSPMRFEMEGDDASQQTFRCRAYATDRESGDVLKGTWITWKMVKAEKWDSKNGSKWLTMPEQMFQYRAAAFWTRLYAPELSLGIHTADEVQDAFGHVATVQQTPPDMQALQDRLKQRALESQVAADTAELDAVTEPKPLQVDPDTGEVLPEELQ